MSIKEITSLLSSLKKCHKEYLGEGLDVTVATTDGREWNYQTGDNSYTGGAYGLQHWSVTTLFKESHCGKLAAEIVNELRNMVAESKEYESAGLSAASLN